MNFRAKKKYFKSVKYDRLGACIVLRRTVCGDID